LDDAIRSLLAAESFNEVRTLGVGLSVNRIVVRSSDGDSEVDSYPGLEVAFQRTGSTVIVHEGAVFANVKVFTGSNSYLEFEPTHQRGIRNTAIDMRGGDGAQAHVGANTSIESCRISMGNENRASISIGANCMISSNVEFRVGDGHAMFNLDAPDVVINRTRPIRIADHVWIGSGVVFLKGASVGEDSVVATRAVVSKPFDEKNTVLAGTPATVVKRGIGWSREYISRYPE